LTSAKLFLWAAMLAVPSAYAAGAPDDCPGPSDDCVATRRWNFSVGLGAGVRTNPLVNGRDIPLVVVPHVSYYGKRFFLDDLEGGFTFVENAANTLSLIATPGYDRVYFYRTDLQNFFITGVGANSNVRVYTVHPTVEQLASATWIPPHSRDITYLAGPEWTFQWAGITGQLDLLHEITGHNHGDEVRAALGMPLITFKGTLAANVGITWKSAAIVDYFYGVPEIYQGRAALDPFVKLGYTLPLSSRWRFNAFAVYERLAGGIASSPIVAEHDVATVFVGAIYTF
jgi:outer membrane protein